MTSEQRARKESFLSEVKESLIDAIRLQFPLTREEAESLVVEKRIQGCEYCENSDQLAIQRTTSATPGFVIGGVRDSPVGWTQLCLAHAMVLGQDTKNLLDKIEEELNQLKRDAKKVSRAIRKKVK